MSSAQHSRVTKKVNTFIFKIKITGNGIIFWVFFLNMININNLGREIQNFFLKSFAKLVQKLCVCGEARSGKILKVYFQYGY